MQRWVVTVAVVWCALGSHALAKPDADTKAITAVIEDQFTGFRNPTRSSSVYATTAMVAMTGGPATPQVNKLSDAEGKWTIFGPSRVGKHKVRDLRVGIAKDGKSAWASFIAKVTVDGLTTRSGAIDYRVTELLSRTSDGWQVQAAAWSIGVANAALKKAAKAESLPKLESVFDQNLGERDVLGAMKSLATRGLDASATSRADAFGIGLVTGEATLGGKKLAAKLKKEWIDKVTLDGSTWAVTSGTTACATVNVRITRGTATIPARLFAVFEKDAGDAWSPVLVHLAAAL